MTTRNETIEIIKSENPTLRIGNDEVGYTELSQIDYEATILDWAESRLAVADAIIKAESDKAALINKLGLTADEAKLLLG